VPGEGGKEGGAWLYCDGDGEEKGRGGDDGDSAQRTSVHSVGKRRVICQIAETLNLSGVWINAAQKTTNYGAKHRKSSFWGALHPTSHTLNPNSKHDPKPKAKTLARQPGNHHRDLHFRRKFRPEGGFQ